MNVIDHAILIPSSPAFIWGYLGNIANNSQWQEDCQSVSFLTTQHEGRGTRWRYSTGKADYVVEITAWYETLGYEYTIVDGASYSENKGRIRLQEIAEGTLVQWTFNYETEGILGGLKNSIGIKRALTKQITTSLLNLHKYIQRETGGITTHEAKSIMRDAPDVDARSEYQPRHPSNTKMDAVPDNMEMESNFQKPISYSMENEGILEPPVAEDDTKPNPIVQDVEDLSRVSPEPTFLNQIEEAPIEVDDTKPTPAITDTMEDSNFHLPVVIPEPIKPFVAIEDTKRATDEHKVEPVETTQQEPPQPAKDSLVPLIREPEISKLDTGQISVFEIFGLQKPSDTQEMEALSLDDIPVPVPTPPKWDDEEDELYDDELDEIEEDEIEKDDYSFEIETMESREVKNQILETLELPQLKPSLDVEAILGSITIRGLRYHMRMKHIKARRR